MLKVEKKKYNITHIYYKKISCKITGKCIGISVEPGGIIRNYWFKYDYETGLVVIFIPRPEINFIRRQKSAIGWTKDADTRSVILPPTYILATENRIHFR